MKNSTQKFEIGKWYKYNNINKHYFKVSENVSITNGSVRTSEDIFETNYRSSVNVWSVNKETKLLEDLSEIQEFLPSNHPDKVPTSLVGRYLKALKNNGANIPEGEFGIIKEEGNNYHRTEFTKYGTHSVTFNNGYFELMPVGFCLDNVIPEYVECVNSWHKDWTTGKIYKTEEVQQYFPEKLTVKCDKGIATNVEEWDVRKGFGGGFKISTKELYQAQNKPTIKEKPMETNNSEFKVGEWVIGWHADYKDYQTEAWQIGEIGYNKLVPKNDKHADTSPSNVKKAELHQIPTKNLSNEELLDIAKQYFKVGTRFICSNTTQEAVISTANFKMNGNYYINEYDDKQNFMLTNDYYHCIYSNKAFAKIISSPNKTEEITPSVKVSNFVLPDKWVVCPETEDNLILIKQYFNKFENYKISRIDNAYTSDGKYQTFVEDALKKGYTQITFDEFKNYVFQRQNTTTQQTKKIENQIEIKQYPVAERECTRHPKLIPLKVRGIKQNVELPKRTKLRIIKPQLLTI